MNIEASKLLEKFRSKTARIGVIGLGYVGLPLVQIRNAALVVDTRNAIKRPRKNVVKA